MDLGMDRVFEDTSNATTKITIDELAE